jgi:hypothetical protein
MKSYICSLCMLFFLFLFSCSTVIVRWTGTGQEKGDRILELSKETDVFNDFLWTTPPLYAKKLVFSNGVSKVFIKNQPCIITLKGRKSINVGFNQEEILVQQEVTKRNYYYNMDVLQTKRVPRSKWVPVTKWVTERVSVLKTRTVPRRVMVTKTRQVWDSFTESFRTEFYNEWETQWVTESYTDWENRQVMKTEWEWQTVWETIIDIPVYAVYKFQFEDMALVIYKILEANDTIYYLQNVSYLTAVEKESGFFGNMYDVNIIFIDADSNGTYFDDEDCVLFNSWYPYKRDSSYQEISRFMDNQWYRYIELKNDMFISMSADPDLTMLFIRNANSEYIDSKEKGKIIITNLEQDDKLIINDREYKGIKKGIFESQIEFGYFALRVKRDGYLDAKQNFLIDSAQTVYEFEYKPTEKAGTLIITAHGFRNWKITAIDRQKNMSVFYNENEIALLPGDYKIIISSGGTNFSKDVTISTGKRVKYNFSEDEIVVEED